MQVSIIIVSYNTKALLQQTLDALQMAALKHENEIIVVDNNSSDGSSDMLRQSFNGVKLIQNDRNSGFSVANNQASEVAGGEYLLFLNSDTIVKKGSIERMAEWLENNPDSAIVGPKLLNQDGSLQLSCGVFPNLRTEFYLRSFLSRFFPANPVFGSFKLSPEQHQNSRPVDWLSGACLMIRKSVFEQVNRFDEKIYMFYEDVDLCYSVDRLGKSVYYLADAEVFHLHGGSWLDRREIPVKNSCTSALYFFEKHYTTWQTIVLRILLFLEIVLAHLVFVPYLLLKREKLTPIYARLRGYYACLRHIAGFRQK